MAAKMKWHKFSEDHSGGYIVYRQSGGSEEVRADFGDYTLTIWKADEDCPWLCTIREGRIFIGGFEEPDVEVFLIITVKRDADIVCDIVTDGVKIGYIENKCDRLNSRRYYVPDELNMITDEVPFQAMVLTAAHRDAILEMGSR